MNWFNAILILLAAFVVVFAQASFNGLRDVIGVQVDLLPSLVVYASLSSGLPTLTLVAGVGGLWADSLSANPPGISVLPLFLIGLLIERYHGLILRDLTFTQLVLGLAVSAAAPVLTLLLLVSVGAKPLVGWFSLWQWLVMSLAGALMTPVWFMAFDRVNRVLNYRPPTRIKTTLPRRVRKKILAAKSHQGNKKRLRAKPAADD